MTRQSHVSDLYSNYRYSQNTLWVTEGSMLLAAFSYWKVKCVTVCSQCCGVHRRLKSDICPPFKMVPLSRFETLHKSQLKGG